MSSFKEFKNRYENQTFYIKGKSIYIKELIQYIGSNKYRIIYEENYEIKYLNNLIESEFLNFIDNLKIDKKKISMENSKTKNIDQLTDKLYNLIDDLYNDKITIEKAIAISKISQVVLNAEKQKSFFLDKKL